MSDKGWIKTYRKIQDCWIWLEKEPFDKRSAWIDLLLTANHEDAKIRFNGEFITVEKGQIVTSIRKLSEKWHWSLDKVSRFLRLIESDKMIRRDSDKFRTLITIENYELYQEVPNTYSTEAVSKQNVSRNKQELKIKNNNNICAISSHEQEDFQKNFDIIYASYPKKVGKARGFDLYKGWLKGRDISGNKVKLTNKQIWNAIAKYKNDIEQNGTELQFVKQFDTFMNKAILDYVDETE